MAHKLRQTLALAALALLAACAGYDGRGLQPGVASVDDVIAVMGAPAMRWQDADGSQQLAYPRGPSGVHTYMVKIAPDGRLIRIDNVLQASRFARITPGQDNQESILRLLGPPEPSWTLYFKARDELVWEWAFCDDWSRRARFGVLFDASTGLVRSTYQQPDQIGARGGAPYCGR